MLPIQIAAIPNDYRMLPPNYLAPIWTPGRSSSYSRPSGHIRRVESTYIYSDRIVDHYPSLKFAAASCQKRKYFKKNTPSTRRRVGAYLKFPKKEIFQTKKITINSPASGRLFEISKKRKPARLRLADPPPSFADRPSPRRLPRRLASPIASPIVSPPRLTNRLRLANHLANRLANHSASPPLLLPQELTCGKVTHQVGCLNVACSSTFFSKQEFRLDKNMYLLVKRSTIYQ
jgi:hypothetical protein